MTLIIFPAIDLRQGKVVRLKEGDPSRQTQYGSDPAEMARKWLDAGAKWLHVVNLDGAFEKKDTVNLRALNGILNVAQTYNASVQFGGGIRSLLQVNKSLDLGVSRVIIGTAAIKDPIVLEKAIVQWGPEKIGLGVDARDGIVQIRGWKEATQKTVLDTAQSFLDIGLKWLVFTDIARDGMQSGLNLKETREIADVTKINVIASGGVKNIDDVNKAKEAQLAGVIIGRALYEGSIEIQELFDPKE